MKVTALGHASILVELKGATCLMDPVFFDPFEEDAVVSCPKRIVYPEKLPPIDILVVSHRHPDHFDIRSLARVSRDCDAICPADPLIVYALQKLGFTRIHPVHPMGSIASADFELYPSRSEVGSVREFGMVFRDRSGTFWNQVDTSLSADTIATVLGRFGPVDLLFAMYASQNFDFFDSLSARFPFETHRQNLENVLRINPRMVAPASAGFGFHGDHVWLNAFLFPISPQRFAADLARLSAEVAIRIMRPGDVFEIADGEVQHFAGISEIVHTEADDTSLLDFNPTTGVPELTDPNPEGRSLERLVEATECFITEGLANYALAADQAEDRVLRLYRDSRAHYAIEVVFPGSESRWHGFKFTPESVDFRPGRELARSADMVHRIAASALVAWIERRKSFFYVRAYSRRFTTLYRLSVDNRHVRAEPVELPDLLMHYLLNVAPGSEVAAKRHVDLQIEAVTGCAAGA
jgi:UDP-MurNAc hydroxylase